MPSDQLSASTVDADAAPASLSSPRWKKPSSGPHPRTGDCDRGPNPSPLGAPSCRSELKRRLRESAEAARGSGDGGRQRLGLAGVTVGVGHGAVQSLWSDADEVTLLAAAAAFRERTGRVPRLPDAAALFGSIGDSISPHIDEAKAYDKLSRLESKFLHGASGSPAGTHDRRVHDLSTKVWGLANVVSPPEDDSDGQDAEESCSDERRLIIERAPPVDALMPPDAATLDADAAPAPPSPPIAKKHPPSPQRGMDGDRQDPNSSPRGSPSRRSEPNRRLRTSAERHEDVQSLEPGGVAVDVGQRLEPADDGGHGAAPNYPRTWSDADEVTLLEAAAAFRERTGQIPQKREYGTQGCCSAPSGAPSPRTSTRPRCTTSFVASRASSGTRRRGKSATGHDRLVHDLCAKVRGFGNTVARDASTVMPVVTEVLAEYWKMNERALAGFPLEKGLSLLSKKEGRLMETRWRKQLDEEMQTQMQRHDLAKEICVLLNDTVKDLSS
uniref:Glabrous enhancer-binding protein-like DBD domain-containing protein n=1 Tax=Setaria italica TaxID=4555 RepID=K3YRV9_SETIT